MEPFWEQSWEHVDKGRVNAYVNGVSLSSDSIIEYWKAQQAESVCDAGCGCGVYSLKLAANGFRVLGFDVSPAAVALSKELLSAHSLFADLKTADILATGYGDNQFDGVISRDVIDHMTFQDGIAAVRELHRITKPGGSIFLTLDRSDPEDEKEPHLVNEDGDYLFTEGKWKGMVFHPYSEAQIFRLVQVGTIQDIKTSPDGFEITIVK